MKDYRLFIANKTRSVYVKKYNDYINQIVIIKNNDKTPHVELSVAGTHIDQTLLDELQIALNRAKKDARELE